MAQHRICPTDGGVAPPAWLSLPTAPKPGEAGDTPLIRTGEVASRFAVSRCCSQQGLQVDHVGGHQSSMQHTLLVHVMMSWMCCSMSASLVPVIRCSRSVQAATVSCVHWHHQ